MTTTKTLCPVCQGKKTIPGICQCSSEWRGTPRADGGWDACQCTPEQKCSTCGGTGYVK